MLLISSSAITSIPASSVNSQAHGLRIAMLYDSVAEGDKLKIEKEAASEQFLSLFFPSNDYPMEKWWWSYVRFVKKARCYYCRSRPTNYIGMTSDSAAFNASNSNSQFPTQVHHRTTTHSFDQNHTTPIESNNVLSPKWTPSATPPTQKLNS